MREITDCRRGIASSHAALVLAAIMLASLALGGCLFKESSIEKTTVAATATPTLEATVEQTTESPSPSPTVEPTEEASPSPTPEFEDVKPECSISVNPNESPGPFKALVAVRFYNYQPTGNVTIKCSAQDPGAEGEKRGEFYYAKCEYPYVFEKKILTASATSDIVSCATTVLIQGNPQFAKMWTFSPGDEEFTANKTEEPSFSREYTISNSGTLPLSSIACRTDATWAVPTCPDTLAIGETRKFKIAFTISDLDNRMNNVALTVTEVNLNKVFSIGVNVVS